MATLANLIVNISANSAKLVAGLSGAGSAATKFAGVVAKAGAAAGVALAGVGIAAGKMAADFESDMANVGTLLGKEGSGRVKELGEDVKRLAQTTGKDLGDLTGALYQTVSALGDSKDSVAILEIAAKGAAAGLANTGSVVDLLAGTMKGYGEVNAAAAQKVSDLAFQTVKLGVTTMPELAATMGRVVPLASTLGVEMESLFGSVATLTGVTGNTAEVTTQLRATMQALINPTTEMAALLEKTGFATGKAAIESLGLQGTLDKLKEATNGNDQALAKAFGSVEALNAVLALTGAQAATFTEKTKAMTNASGASAEAFGIQQKSVNAMMARLKQTLNVVLVNLGEQFLPMLNNMAQWVQDHMPQIQAFFESAFNGAGAAMAFLGDTVIPALVQAFNTAKTAVQWVIDNWPTIQPIVTTIAGVIAAVLIPQLVALGVAATVAAAKNVAAFASMLASTVASSAQFYAAIAQMVARWVFLGVQSTIQAAKVAASWVVAMGPIAWVTAAIIALVALIIANWDTIKEATEKAWAAVANFVSNAVNSIKDWFTGLVTSARQWGSDLMQQFLAGITGWFSTISDRVTGFISGLKSRVSDAISGATSRISSFTSSIGSVIGGAVQAVIPDIPGFATGGVVPGPVGAPTLAVVHGGERILTPAQQRTGGTGGNTTVVNVRVEGPVYGVLDFEQRVTQTIRDAVQGGAFRGVIATP